MGKRAEAFLTIFGAVFREYQSRLGDRIDFEDMVNRATALVESGRYQSPFRHILVDEFQDISTGRAADMDATGDEGPQAAHGRSRSAALAHLSDGVRRP